MPSAHESILAHIAQSSRTIAALADQAEQIQGITRACQTALQSGGKILTCGNGGSAAQALHLAEELLGKYSKPRPPLAATCLNADPTTLTCIANDFGFEHVFKRQIEALATPNDVLVVFTTSGKSPNLVLALEAARARGAVTVGLLGKTGGPCAPLCDHSLIVNANDTAHIQEAHLVILHLILEAVEA